jgi:predicted nucleic acid-binding protein
MLPRVLDANRLIRHWQNSRPRSASDARQLARKLIELHGTSAIVTPVVIEFECGTRDQAELTLARAYLGEFEIIDQGRILPEDFVLARQLAAPRQGITRRRSFADCLIRAIALRLNFGVDTADTGFPRRIPPRSSGKAVPQKRRNKRR